MRRCRPTALQWSAHSAHCVGLLLQLLLLLLLRQTSERVYMRTACISAGDIRPGDHPEVDGALLGVLEQQLEPRRLHHHDPLRHP